jgi:hypothetical protein
MLWGTLALLVLGAWYGFSAFEFTPFPPWVYIGSLLLVALAAALEYSQYPKAHRLRASLSNLLQQVRSPSRQALWLITLGLMLASALYLYGAAIYAGRTFGLKWHDEFSFALQARMFASGHLWMPQHPLADFFDSFYVLTRPVYASERFPGLTLMLVPGLWLGWPMWVIPLLIASACVGLLYAVMTRLLDGLFGLLAALLLVSGFTFRIFSLMVMAQLPVILLGLTLILVWLQWRKSRSWGWMALMGALGGWLAVTRPLDAICYLAPLLLAVLMDLRPWRWKQLALSAAVALLTAAPFLALQLTLNVRLTGRVMQTPFSFYNQRNEPELTFGFSHPTDRQPITIVPQKRIFYEQIMRPWVRRYTPDQVVPQFFHLRLPSTLAVGLPRPILLFLIPVGLLGLIDRRYWVMFVPLLLFLGLYAFYPTFTFYHPLVVIPSTLLLLGLGLRQIERLLPSRPLLGVLAPAGMVALVCLSMLPPINVRPRDNQFILMSQNHIDAKLASIHRPAVVLFRFSRGANPEAEPVYNIAAPWPDDAPVIRAHDLGLRNAQLIAYYAQRQPARELYLYNRSNHQLIRLGSAAALNNGMRSFSSASRPNVPSASPDRVPRQGHR